MHLPSGADPELGQWHELLLLGRWHAFYKQLPLEIREHVLRMRESKDVDIAKADAELEPDRLEFVSESLRQWADVIIENSEEPLAVKEQVIKAVRMLQGMASGLRAIKGPKDKDDGRSDHFHHTAVEMLQVVFLSRFISNASSLREVLQRAVNLVYPSL